MGETRVGETVSTFKMSLVPGLQEATFILKQKRQRLFI